MLDILNFFPLCLLITKDEESSRNPPILYKNEQMEDFENKAKQMKWDAEHEMYKPACEITTTLNLES